jgi:hypothetical protein
MAATPRALAIIQAVAATVEATVADVLGPSRYQRITFARAMAMLAVERFYVPKLSHGEIGLIFGRDGSTVLSALRKARHEAEDPRNADVYDAAMTAAFEAWTSAAPWAPAPTVLTTPVKEPTTRGQLTAALVAPVLDRGASLAAAAKELGCSVSALYHVQKREPELRQAYRAAARRGRKSAAKHKRNIASLWNRGKMPEAAE